MRHDDVDSKIASQFHSFSIVSLYYDDYDHKQLCLISFVQSVVCFSRSFARSFAWCQSRARSHLSRRSGLAVVSVMINSSLILFPFLFSVSYNQNDKQTNERKKKRKTKRSEDYAY